MFEASCGSIQMEIPFDDDHHKGLIVYAASALIKTESGNEPELEETNTEQPRGSGDAKRKRRGSGFGRSGGRYHPSETSRRSHNEKERKRRSRMKDSCQMMRSLVPGLEPTTDKATVMEHAVHYLIHLNNCRNNNCSDYVPLNLADVSMDSDMTDGATQTNDDMEPIEVRPEDEVKMPASDEKLTEFSDAEAQHG